ncbi:MAG: glycine--tRNA ligase subunit beta [Rubricella sp.]
MPDLLIELFSEEIPARMQAKASDDLRRMVTDGLVEAGLTYAGAAAFATPRRLALTLEGLTERTPDRKEERKGPRVDAPEKALEGFLRSTGLTKDQLEIRPDKKGDVYFAVIDQPGRVAEDVIAEVLEQTIRNFPWPKSMRWGAGSLRWVRPLHSILCILWDEAGARTVPLAVDGIVAGDTTEGHRFMAPGRFAVSSFEDYAAKLKKAHVILDPAERAEHIWADATQMAFAQGLEVVEDKGLLAEVAGLVEWPVVLMGPIGEDFLGLPPEVLQTSMREHQKFFSVKDASGRIVRYVTVANRETADKGATILQGNGKVLAARLSDAKFFWENDLQTVREKGLEGMAAPLANVTFHARLGSQAERINRIEALAREIAPKVGAKPDLAAEAARVAKADLSSEMVYEFPELQGIMGRYYAQAAGHDDGVPEACEMHYKPLGPSDDVPTDPVSVAVALADKIDTLTGFWAIDEKPTGSKDPYALRRAALGVIRLVLENGVRISLMKSAIYPARSAHWFQKEAEEQAQLSSREEFARFILGISEEEMHQMEKERSLKIRSNLRDLFDKLDPGSQDTSAFFESTEIGQVSRPADDLLSFIHDRLKVHLRSEGTRHDVIDACLALPGSDDLVLLVARARALDAFLRTEDGENLVQGFRRANNILTAEERKDGVEYSFGPDPALAENDAEKALFAALDSAEPAIAGALEAEDFEAAMGEMAKLRAPIDAFFEATVVNAENQILRRNRLNLLHRIRQAMAPVAQFDALEG